MIHKFSYNGENVKFNYIEGDHIATCWKSGYFYEQRLLEKIKSLNLNGVYIDVGSHFGNHSIYFDKFCKSNKVISIEGNPSNFNYLNKNIIENNCKNILYNEIVSDSKGDILTMEYNLKNTGNSKVIHDINKINTKNTLTITNITNTLDNLLKNEENITIIKLDIEGYEYKALLGAQSIINRHHPVIITELHHDNSYYNEIINFLNKNNYKTDNINYAYSPTFIYIYREV